jgi:hypothetical protein
MDTRDRSVSRSAPAGKIDRIGLSVVAAGCVVMTLGILEIGGLFNIVLGFYGALGGCVLMFAREGTRESEEEAEFRRELDEL